MANSPIGSIWRKWDLQIHTPHSHLNHSFDSDFDLFAKKLFRSAVENDIWAIGITDYFTIEGYKALRAILDDPIRLNEVCDNDQELISRVKEILFLPNIEFRLNLLVNAHRVNLHIIFSDEVSPVDIEENFLHDLEFVYQGNPQDIDTKYKLKIRNLELLGSRLKNEHQNFQQDSDIFVGMANAVVDHTQMCNILDNKKTLFKGKYLIGVPSDEDLCDISWNGQGHNLRKVIIQKSDFLFATNPNTIQWALGKKSDSLEAHISEFKGIKACFGTSDAHGYEELFSPDNDRHTWLKADTTFRGLQQVLIEPEDRVYVGDKPILFSRVEKNKTRFIRAISCRKKTDSQLSEKWFDFEIELNFNLIAIIGNKGGGKSALADIIGLAGNSSLEKYFSFLNDDKFRRRKENKAPHFTCRIYWEDNENVDEKNLNSKVIESDVERVKYIPQSYLEKICSDIGTVDETGFSGELEDAIFSSVDEADKLGKSSLRELIKYKTQEIRESILLIQQKLNEHIETLVELEIKGNPTYRIALERQLKQRKLEHDTKKLSCPDEVPEPDPLENNPELLDKIKQIEEKSNGLENQIKLLVDRKAECIKKQSVISKLKSASQNLRQQFLNFRSENEQNCDYLEIDFDSFFKLEIDNDALDENETLINDELALILQELDIDNSDSITAQKKQVDEQLENLKADLAVPQKKYKEYLIEKRKWEIDIQQIVGDETVLDSIIGLESQINSLSDIQEQIKLAQNMCVDTSVEIFEHFIRLRDIYVELYQPIQKSVDRHELVKNNLLFTVSISPTNFHELFLNLINQRRKGSFSGAEEGSLYLKELLQEMDFESIDGLREFFQKILYSLSVDKSRDGNESVDPHSQLKAATTPQKFYQQLFNLDYLLPQYSLLWQGKQIEQLSPGERGTLLLIFYLLVDKTTTPLIIDQPEENLDNQTVYGILVPAIKEAKSRRQIIIVTHNPNLAVVCDAEQIIYAEVDKEQQNSISYYTGAIENPLVNNHIINVLEGTRPAFQNRESKYKDYL